MKHILFLNARRRIFFMRVLKKYLNQEKYQVGVASSDVDKNDPVGYYVDCFRTLPPSTDPMFKKHLLAYIKEENIIGVMVWNDHDFIPVSKFRKDIEASGARLLIPSVEMINNCIDKIKSAYFLNQNNIPNPVTIEDVDGLLKKDSLPFPLIIKPRKGSGSMHVYSANTIEELKVIKNLVPDAIAQAKIKGIHYTIDIFIDNQGVPFSIVPRRRVKVHGSEALISEIELNPRVIAVAQKFALAYKQPGAVNIQIIEDSDNNCYVIDINTRIGGGTDLTIKAGAPFHEWIAQYFLGIEFKKDHTIQEGLMMTRYYESIFIQNQKLVK